MQYFFCLVIFIVGSVSKTMAADDVILLDPLASRNIAFEVPLFAYKQFPEKLFAGQKGEAFGFPTELIYASAAKVPAIEAAAAASGKDVFDLAATEVVALARSKRLEFGSNLYTPREAKTFVPWAGSEVDALFVTSLVSSELVESSFDIFDSELIGERVEMISINKRVGLDFWNAYSNLSDIQNYDPSDQVNQFQDVQATLSRYPRLLEAAKISLSPVSFGEIFAFSETDKDLKIPPPIARKI